MLRRLLPVLLLLGTTTGHAAPDDPPAGKVRLALTGSIETLDPAKAASETARVCIVNVFDQLYEWHHLQRPYELRPCLAASLPEISEDGRTQTIRLRKGIRFADDPCFERSKGRLVTAEDAAFCIRRLMDAHVNSPGTWLLQHRIVGLDAFALASKKPAKNPKRAAYRATEGYPDVKGLEVVDDHTLRIHLTKPVPELAGLLASPWLSIYAPEAVRTYGKELGRHAVGTGPYRVVLYMPGRTLMLRRNPHYRVDRYPTEGPRGSDLREAGGILPRNETVEVTAYEKPLEAWQVFLNGDADLAEVPRDDEFESVVDPASGKLLPYLVKRGVTLHRDPRLEIHYDAFNWEDPVLGAAAGEKGRAIRYAICLATDNVYSLTRLYKHQSERVFGPILPEMPGFNPRLKNESLRGEEETREEVLEAAREMLADAGFDEKNRVPVLRMHIPDDPGSRQIFNIFQKQCADVAIRVEPVPVPWKDLLAILREKKAQMFVTAWHADVPDAFDFLQLFYGPNAPNPNFSNYRNKEFDELYDVARRLPPGEEREDLCRDLEKIVVEDCPWRFRFRRVRWTAVQRWLRGFRFNDVAAKYFKYCRPDEAQREATRKAWK